MKRELFIYTVGIFFLSFSLFTYGGDKKRGNLDHLNVVAKKSLVGNSELISCDLTKLKDTVDLPLSLLVEDLQLIRLDNRDEALIGYSATIVTDNYVLFRNNKQNPYKLFDKKGKFLRTIGAYGQGANEYLNVYDDWLDEKTGQIFILPWQSDKILRFDLQGNALETIPLKYRVPKGKFSVNTANSTVSVFLLPFDGIPGSSLDTRLQRQCDWLYPGWTSCCKARFQQRDKFK